MPEPPAPWRAEKDPNTGATYYWNTETNETSWELPRGGPPANGAPPGAGGAGAYAAKDVFAMADLGASSAVAGDVASWRAAHEVVVSAGCPDPILTFAAANLPPQLLSEVVRAGFPSPSPIQAQAWPVCMQGRDMVGIAKTGSGKTLAFLMPAFLHITQQRPDPRRGPCAQRARVRAAGGRWAAGPCGRVHAASDTRAASPARRACGRAPHCARLSPRAARPRAAKPRAAARRCAAPRRARFTLVLAPTRELATQILDECNKFGRVAGMSATCCYGGAPKGMQLRDLQRGVYARRAAARGARTGESRIERAHTIRRDCAERALTAALAPAPAPICCLPPAPPPCASPVRPLRVFGACGECACLLAAHVRCAAHAVAGT